MFTFQVRLGDPIIGLANTFLLDFPASSFQEALEDALYEWDPFFHEECFPASEIFNGLSLV